jgi:peptidyl-prolyl cis-trans isomerase SurA
MTARPTSRTWIVVIGLGLGLAWPGRPQARVVEKIAAVVGDEIVLQSEVEERAAPFLQELAAVPDPSTRATRAAALRREVLERIIDETLLVQQATELKLNVTAEEVDRSIDQVKRANRQPDGRDMTDQQLQESLRQMGVTMAQYRQNMRRELLKYKVQQIAVGSKVSVTDSDVQSYYERHLKSGANVQVRVAHIFIAVPADADAATVRQKEELAKQLAARAKGGEDFAKLAKEFSEDRATRAEGGDLGDFGKDMGLPKPVEELVFGMKAGEVGGPVRANRGFSVLKVLDRKAKDVRPLADIKDELRRQLWEKEIERQTRSYLADLRKKTLVEIRN